MEGVPSTHSLYHGVGICVQLRRVVVITNLLTNLSVGALSRIGERICVTVKNLDHSEPQHGNVTFIAFCAQQKLFFYTSAMDMK